MKRFIEGADRNQSTLLPDCLDDWVDESNPVRVVDAFVDALDLKQLGFDGIVPEETGRPSYHPSRQRAHSSSACSAGSVFGRNWPTDHAPDLCGGNDQIERVLS